MRLSVCFGYLPPRKQIIHKYSPAAKRESSLCVWIWDRSSTAYESGCLYEVHSHRNEVGVISLCLPVQALPTGSYESTRVLCFLCLVSPMHVVSP